MLGLIPRFYLKPPILLETSHHIVGSAVRHRTLFNQQNLEGSLHTGHHVLGIPSYVHDRAAFEQPPNVVLVFPNAVLDVSERTGGSSLKPRIESLFPLPWSFFFLLFTSEGHRPHNEY